jgi:GxxExxY protein
MAVDLSRHNAVAEAIIGAAIKVHRGLGPGLLESVYLACLIFELHRGGLRLKAQVRLPVRYEDV